ncbi:MAG: succinylglutamate desuccinylase/aspartoacylase family protein [Bacteroidota bacterium]
MAKKKKREFIINNEKIEPGQNKLVELNVARLPSGNVIDIRIHVYRSQNPGPTLLVMGGVHGDEINGVEIVRRAIDQDLFQDLKAGSVIAIPLLNIYGFINFSRDMADGKDVNRNFPGSMRGSLASRVAANVTKKVLPLIDFGIDFHTGGSSRYNYPQIRFSTGDKQAEKLARQFRAPYLIRKNNIPKSLRKVSLGMGIPIIIFEGGESLRYDGFSIENGLAGLRRLMFAQGMVDQQVPNHRRIIMFNKTGWVRAQQAGMFIWSQQSGAKVSAGELLGVINNPNGHDEIPVLADRDSYLIGHNNAPVVSAGDALFHIGYQFEFMDQ